MRRTAPVWLLAGLMALCFVKAAASPVAGTWEGMKDGVKAVTLKVEQNEGILGGSVIFYIIRDEGSGTHNGAPTPPMTLEGTQWSGSVLRFLVTNQERKSVAFEFRITGEGKGELKRPAQNGEPEIRVLMTRAR